MWYSEITSPDFFGRQHARMMSGYPPMEDTWSTRGLLCHISACAESMPINIFQDMYRCLHFSNTGKRTETPVGKVYTSMKRYRRRLLSNIEQSLVWSRMSSMSAGKNLCHMYSILLLMKIDLPAGITHQLPSFLNRNPSGLAQPFVQCVLHLVRWKRSSYMSVRMT